MQILQLTVLRLYSYYKKAAIRYVKNISLLIAFGCVVTTIVVLAAPATQSTILNTPANGGGGGGCWDKKLQMEQAKKNYILRRFISYEPVNNFN